MPQPPGSTRIFYGWYVLAASFVILFLNAGGRFIIGVMLKPMAEEFDWSRGAISAVIFLNLAVYALSTLVTGRMYDRWGPKWVIVVSAVLFSAGYALMATMNSLWEFVVFYGILAAAGFGGTSVPIFGSIIGRWFESRRGLAVSLAIAGNCLGQFLLIPAFADLVQISGWRNTSLWIAGLSIVVNLALALAVIRGDPEQFGLRAYRSGGRTGDDSAVPPQAKPSEAKLPRAKSGVDPGADPAVVVDLTLVEAMRTRSLWLFTGAMFICGGADFFVATHLVPLVTDYGLPKSVAADMFAWLGLLSLPGILLAGPAADTIGNKIPIAVTFAVRVLLFAMLLAHKGAVSFWVFSLGMGLTLLVTAPLTPTLVGALYGVRHIGFISGFISTVHMLGGGLWSYLGGIAFDHAGDYDLAILFTAVTSALALACTLLIREERHYPRQAPTR